MPSVNVSGSTSSPKKNYLITRVTASAARLGTGHASVLEELPPKVTPATTAKPPGASGAEPRAAGIAHVSPAGHGVVQVKPKVVLLPRLADEEAGAAAA